MRNPRGVPTIFIIDGVTITVNFDEHPPRTFTPGSLNIVPLTCWTAR